MSRLPARVKAWTKARGVLAEAGPTLGRHWVFLVVLTVGAVLRVLCMVAYHPALLFNGDSYTYLFVAQRLRPPLSRPAGYPALLYLARPLNHLAVVPVAQHLLGLGLGVTLYLLLLKRGAPRWLAVLVAVPVLLDAYQIDIEQFVMAETVFEALLLAALVVLLRRVRPSVSACVVVGLLLAAATLTRTVALTVVVLVAIYLIARRLGPRRLAAFLVAAVLPLLGYAAWFHSAHGVYALERFDGHFLWGRVEQFADCSKWDVPANQIVLCDPTPAAQRPGPNGYLYGARSPLRKLRIRSRDTDPALGSFARHTIRHQPVDYAEVIGGDVAHYFAPGRNTGRRDWFNGTWEFPARDRKAYWHVNLADVGIRAEPLPSQHPSPGVVRLLRSYQRFGYTPGPLLLGALMFAVGAALWRRPGEGRARWDVLLLASAGLTMLVLPAATTSFDFRYLLPTLVLFPPAAGLALVFVLNTRAPIADSLERRASDEAVQPKITAASSAD
jgi:hypothetical protein